MGVRLCRRPRTVRCMADLLAELKALLDLEEIDPNLYRGFTREEPRPRVFGGLVAGQALAAGCRTVQTLMPHSLHAYFLRPGRQGEPIIYHVDRIRDGRSFATRRVKATQRGEAIFNMSVSYHKEEAGFQHQDEMPSDVPAPENCIRWQQWIRPLAEKMPPELRDYMLRDRPIEMRPVDPMDWDDPAPDVRTQSFWMRALPALPDDPTLHRCLMTYASDMALLGVAMRPHRRGFWSPDMMAASLDHALWFHRPFRFDDWLLYDQYTPAAAGARGFALGSIFSRGGERVASVAQEGLIRQIER